MTRRHLCVVCGKEYIDAAQKTPDFNASAWSPLAAGEGVTAEIISTRILSADKRYAAAAYLFVRIGVMKAIARHHPHPHEEAQQRVSAPEVLDALRELAIRKFGGEAKAKLNAWGIFKCEDFGDIVFNLIEAGLLMQRSQDSKADFQGGYDFEWAFPL